MIQGAMKNIFFAVLFKKYSSNKYIILSVIRL